MTRRGVRLVLAAAGLSFAAAALAWVSPLLPEGLAAACAPDPVARALLAGLAVAALLAAPALVADEPGREAEDHTALLVLLPAAPAATALVVAGGGDPSALLPAAALLLACDLASSSYLRADPAGRAGVAWAAGAAALLAALPLAAWGAADLGGWEGASSAFRLSPLLAVRDLEGGWAAVAPAGLLLVAVAAVLRIRAGTARAAAAVLLVAAAASAGSAAAAQDPDARPSVLVVGSPREGPAADLVRDLLARGMGVEEREELPWPAPFETRVVVVARDASAVPDAPGLAARLRSLRTAGVGVVVLPGSESVLGPADDGPLGPFLVAGPPELAERLSRPLLALPHPADPLAAGAAERLLRIHFPEPARSLPGRTLAYLFVVAVAIAGTAVVSRRRGLGQAAAGARMGGVSALATALLFVPGVLGPALEGDRFVLEEGVEGAAAVRRLEVLRVRRARAGGPGEERFPGSPGTRWAEIRFGEDSAIHGDPDTGVSLGAEDRWALFAGDAGVEAPPAPGPYRAILLLRDGRAWLLPPGPWPAARPAGEGPGVEIASALDAWRRSDDPRVSVAGALLGACLRPAHGASLVLLVPESGSVAVALHPPGR